MADQASLEDMELIESGKREEVPRNSRSGMPPPGTGAHPLERFFWQTPVFKKHPLTQEQEAISGIFFRLTPENVRTLQNMKKDGWPHVEIVRVCKELWKRQLEGHQKNEDIVEQHKQISHETKKQEANDIYEPLPGEEGGGSEDEDQGGAEGGEDMENFGRGLSMTSGMDYRNKLETFREKAYNRDGGSSAGTPVLRSKRPEDRNSPNNLGGSVSLLPPLQKSEGFCVEIIKADTTGGERALPAYEIKRKRDQSFTRKEVGVGNSAYTTSDEDEEKVTL